MYYNPSFNNQMNMQEIDRNIEKWTNLKNQYNNVMPQSQIPVQNIINTTSIPVEIEARFLNEGEDISNIIIKNKTLFIDEKRQVISLKELDGSISKTYKIIVPKDEKDLKIESLENQIKEMEMKFNEYAKYNQSINVIEESNAIDNGDVKSTTKKSSK